MPQDAWRSDTVIFTGDPLTRAVDALKVARQQVRLAQSHAGGSRLEDALTEIEDQLSDHLGRIERAQGDDAADAEETGQADRQRRAWFPRYQAA